MLDILKRIQADVSGVKTDVAGLRSDVSVLKTDMADVKGRVTRLEDLAKKQRRDSAALLVMMRGAIGIFDERMRDVEQDVQSLLERE